MVKKSIVLENTYIVLNRMSLEIQMLKALLVNLQKEMKNMLPANDGQSIFVIKWQKIWPNCVLLLCGKQNLKAMNLDI